MFTDEVLEKFFSDMEMQRIPVGCQSTAVRVFERIVEEMVRDDEYAYLSKLLSEYDRSAEL